MESQEIKLEFCKYLGYLKGFDLGIGTYCMKQSEYSDSTHKNLECSKCPHFEAYGYTMTVE